MAWTKVQSANAAFSGTTIAPSLAGVTGGNLVTVQCAYYRGATASSTPPAITDSNGTMTAASVPNSITPVLGGDSGGSAIWAQRNAGAGTHNVTITLDASSAGHATITEWSGGDGTFDQPASDGTTTSATQSRTSGTTSGLAQTTDLALIALCLGSGAGVANAAITDPPGSYSSLFIQDNTTADIGVEFAYQFLASNAGQSATWTWTDATTLFSQGTIATFLLNSPAPPAQVGGLNPQAVGPGKLNLPPRSNVAAALTAPFPPPPPAPTMNLGLVGPGKLRLPPRDYGPVSATTTPAATLGLVPPPGPGVSPGSLLQFRSFPYATTAPGINAPISGLLVSNSLIYGAVTPATLATPFIPGPGAPGPSPFNNLQFTSFPYDTSNPSATNITLAGGILQSNSTFYGNLTAVGALSSLLQSNSTVYGSLTGVTAGQMNGLFGSASLFYGNLVGIGGLAGVSLSNSLVYALQVGSGFQPFVPNTPVLDVRTDTGYEPWSVRPGKTIG
jgi:hypothetical protein